MKKSIIVDFLSGTPSSTYSVSTGYSVGSEWINTDNGNKFYHKTDGDWVPLNVESFYIQGGTSSAFDTTSDIYRTGSLNLGIGTATDGRFVVSSTTGSVSFVVDNSGNIYNYSTLSNTKFGYNSLYNNTTGSNNTAFGTGSLYSNTSGGYNTAYGAYSLSNNSTGVTTFVLSDPGSGYTMSTTFSNVQLSYISGSTASTYPTATVFVGAGGTVSTVTLVTTGTGFKDTTTVMGTNLGSSATFSISVLTISTGGSNTAVGAYSLWKNTTGSFNTALGDNSLIYNTTGSSNVAVGRSSLANNTTGGSNTALGAQTLQNNTTGSFNTTTGHSSLYYNTTGSYNTGNGYLSLQNNSNGISTFKLLDPGSGYTASSTFSNIQLSYISGSTASHVYGITYPKVTVFVGAGGTVSTVTLVTTGTGFIDTSTVMGANLGSATFSIGILTLLSGNYNTAVGAYSLGFNTIGYQNNAVGYGSLYNNISGYYNNAFGLQSLNQNTTGQLNVALGHQSLYNNTTGQQNTVAGYRSLYLNSVGSFNIAIGTRALYSNIADKNTVVGGETMYSNLTGTFNTALGQESLRANIAGSYNTAVGTFALLNSESNYTVAVGRDAGRYSSASNLIASTESLFLGYNSKSLTASSTNEIVIGASASGNGSNSVTLGSDSITKTILKGNIGVGTASPTNVLDVVKNQVGSTRINIENTDTYGISTLRFTKSGGAAAALYENATNEFTFQNATNGGTLRLQTTTSGGATNTALTIDSNQNIGVGTASPSTKLHIFGTQSGAFRLQDGTQAKGYVLTSDANGVGTWEKTSRLFNFTSNTYQTVSGTVSATSSAISSSMFSDSDVLRIQPIITLLAPSVNVVNISYYISTSPTLVGATQIGNYNVIAGNRYIWSDRSFWTLGGIFIGRNFTASSQSSENNSGNNLDSVSIPSTFYILVTATTTGTDLACISSVVIQKV